MSEIYPLGVGSTQRVHYWPEGIQKIGFIYKITCLVTGKIYFGSTFYNPDYRLCQHRQQYKRHLRGKLKHRAVFEVMEHNKYTMDILEKVTVSCAKELRKIENEYIMNNECTNINRAYK